MYAQKWVGRLNYNAVAFKWTLRIFHNGLKLTGVAIVNNIKTIVIIFFNFFLCNENDHYDNNNSNQSHFRIFSIYYWVLGSEILKRI